MLSHAATTHDGLLRYTFHFNTANLRGVGQTSGALYISPRTLNQGYNPNGFPPLEYTTILTEKLVSQDSGDDLVVRITAHTTINADGDVTVTFDNVEFACV